MRGALVHDARRLFDFGGAGSTEPGDRAESSTSPLRNVVVDPRFRQPLADSVFRNTALCLDANGLLPT